MRSGGVRSGGMRSGGMRSGALLLLIAGGIALAGCRFGSAAHRPRLVVTLTDTLPLPPLAVYQIAVDSTLAIALRPAPARDPFEDIASTVRVSVNSDNADARTLLLWLARQAGVSLAVGDDVRIPVTVNFQDVLAVDAIRAIIHDAGLSILVGDRGAPWPPVVFHQVPTNIETATAEAIAARFGITIEMARWIVESRKPIQ